MTGRENRTRETQGRKTLVQSPISAPWQRCPIIALFALVCAAAPLSGVWAQSRDGQLRFPDAGNYPATPNYTSEPVETDPVVIGGSGSGVSVDLSVLDSLDRARGRGLLFPDPNFRGNRERVELTPPGSERVTLTPPGETGSRSKSASRAAPKPQPPSPDIQTARPAPKPSAPEWVAPEVPPSTASAPPPDTLPDTGGASDVTKADPAPMAPQPEPKKEPKAEPNPEPKAAPAPKAAPDTPTVKKSEPAPEPVREATPAPAPETSPPAFDRNAVPPPPMASVPENPAAPGPTAEVPPVDAAPRTGVTQQEMQPPEPPPSTSLAAKAPKEEQTAALPPADAAWTSGQTRAISFPAGGARLPDAGEETLKAAAKTVTADDRLRVELKAYAAGDANSESQARRLSLSRALSVRSFLIREGVQSTRIDVRALGNGVSSGEPDRVDVTVVTR